MQAAVVSAGAVAQYDKETYTNANGTVFIANL